MKLEGKPVLITGGSSGTGFAIARALLAKASQHVQGTQRAYAKGEPFSAQHVVTEEGKKLLFGQTAASVARN